MISQCKRVGLALALTFATLSAHAGLTIQNWTTANGVRVYFVESRALPIVDVQVDFRAGGAEAPVGKAGLAGLARGLLDAGAGNLDEDAIANRVADLGAQIGGGVDMDRASVSLRTLSSAAEREGAVDLLATLIQQPTFPAPAVEREKARSIAGLKESDTQPDATEHEPRSESGKGEQHRGPRTRLAIHPLSQRRRPLPMGHCRRSIDGGAGGRMALEFDFAVINVS